MNSFDSSIIHYVNQFARRSYMFDRWMTTAVGLDVLKGALLVAVLCWFWFAEGEQRARRREIIIATAAACFAAIILGRVLAAALPFRTRPIVNVHLGFIAPYGAHATLRGWSSFPSDHAMLFASMATGLFFMSPAVGLIAYAYSSVVIGVPRLYAGLHYPTDLLCGAALGILFAVIANSHAVRSRIAPGPCRLAESRPGIAYAVAFFVAFQVATMFFDARQLAQLAWCTLENGRSAGCREEGDSPTPAPPPAAVRK